MRSGSPVMMEIAVLIEQAANFVRGSYGAPAIVNALAGQSEMKAEIEVGMRFRVVGDFREPRAGDHDASGVDCTGLERLDRGGVYGVTEAKIVGMDDQELCVGWVAELFGKSISLRNLRVAGTCYSGEEDAAK